VIKHGNTFFPDDAVRRQPQDKTASNIGLQGKVINADPDTGKVKVAWEDGTVDWVAPDDLARQP
jgi:hypothetical protein